jgi:hypothetical protein
VPVDGKPRRKRQPGALKGQLVVGREFFAPLPESELAGRE